MTDPGAVVAADRGRVWRRVSSEFEAFGIDLTRPLRGSQSRVIATGLQLLASEI